MPEDSELVHLWDGRDSDERLDHDTVFNFVVEHMVKSVRPGWDYSTPVKKPWYLAWDEGLRAWCRDVTKLRFVAHPLPSYSKWDYDKILFHEQFRRKGRKAMKNPCWKALRDHMWDTENIEFFRYLHLLLGQKPATWVLGRRMFCLYWDRAEIPLRFWSYPAAALFLQTKVAIKGAAPSAKLLDQWACRLGLSQAYPLVVTDFSTQEGVIPEHGFHLEAFELHRIPPPAAEGEGGNLVGES